MKMEDKANTARLIRLPEVLAMTGLRNRQDLYLGMKKGGFPTPVKISSRAVAWRLNEIQDWIESRPLARGSKENE